MYKGINDYELIYLIRNNDEESLNIMFNKYRKIIISTARTYYDLLKRGDIEDYIQEGFVGLTLAINTFDENKNSLFYTYACLCIKTRILTYCRGLRTKRNEFFYNSYSFDNYDEDTSFSNIIADHSSYNQESYLIDSNNTKELIDFKNSLDIKHSCVFELRCNGFKYREISVLLDLPIRTIQGYMNYCKVKLKDSMKDCIF